MLSQLQNQYLDLLLESGALKFGSFLTKSGRTSPFFLNSGAFDHGAILRKVAVCYAKKVLEFAESRALAAIHLYGPAYKGITLAAATAVEISNMNGEEVPFTFNRKEAKNHGEGGFLVGRQISKSSTIIVVEDVLTGGTSVRDTISLLEPTGATIAAVIVGVDRLERGTGLERASLEIERKHKIPVISLLTIDQIVATLWQDGLPCVKLGKSWITAELMASIEKYRKEWGS